MERKTDRRNIETCRLSDSCLMKMYNEFVKCQRIYILFMFISLAYGTRFTDCQPNRVRHSDRHSFNLNRYLINTAKHTHTLTHNSHRSIVVEGPVRISLAFSSMYCFCAHAAYTRCLLLAANCIGIVGNCIAYFAAHVSVQPVGVTDNTSLFVCLLCACLPINLFVRLSVALCLKTASMVTLLVFNWQLTRLLSAFSPTQLRSVVAHFDVDRRYYTV